MWSILEIFCVLVENVHSTVVGSVCLNVSYVDFLN